MRKSILGLLCALIAACATTSAPKPVASTAEAIELASAARGCSVDVELVMQVMRIENGERGRLFLDSKQDYRDPGSLNVNLAPKVVSALTDLHGAGYVRSLMNTNIRVRGEVQRVPIAIYDSGRRTGTYYQTQLFVANAADIRHAD